MATQAYRKHNIASDRLTLIARAVEVLAWYGGEKLTARQLYYQFIAHDLFPDSRQFALFADCFRVYSRTVSLANYLAELQCLN